MTPTNDERDAAIATLAEVFLASGRHYLSVAGVAVAMEGDKCLSTQAGR